ncbi:septal ring lytic transglycosylase RlpA family protein [Nostoc sp. FACHB-110]|uniref:septal ring lytic transglycosylase RlpA family protein n=1 Tax=Nostoc sp. FACHB-110 TaxID=2692834 RepID=UPI00168753C9|nr:septal ring lytic transglycosylase RlpA family protein [Nostoc sp. FACHB-110]MBD2436982.1 septal ring lytic transglycosylase RlpA family protein [Nostoc sp. FACHB-110]
MNQRHLWTIVALFVTLAGIPSVGRTQAAEETHPVSQKSSSSDVVKVGEFQSPAEKQASDAVITSIHAHSIKGKQAATLYIRNIPVLTFVSSQPIASNQTKQGVVGESQGVQQQSYALVARNSTKVASTGNIAEAGNKFGTFDNDDNDPVQQAGVVAARINQLIQENVDAKQITVSWKADNKTTNQAQDKSSAAEQPSDRYTIKIKDQELVEINENTRLADTTNDLAQDALQATNRLRRLIGNASPIDKIANLPMRSPFSLPKLPQQIAVGNIRLTFRGMASFYGYDGSGSMTASGERFNPEAMTAAHRTLPLGTKVRVTNTRNGRSVVLRINDRGPYIRGRVIDVSAGAARILGMVSSGVAPVHIEVLGR